MGVCMRALGGARACAGSSARNTGAGFSITLAMVFLCAGAIVGALPIAPSGAATQAGAGAAGLVASGVGASQAIEVAVAGQTLGALAGTAILVFCLVRRVKTRA